MHAESLVVAEPPDALVVLGEALGLLAGEPGLAAAAAADEACAGGWSGWNPAGPSAGW